ncbi:MAG: hypothetical protein ACR2J3_11110 [Aridibacter sp.]
MPTTIQEIYKQQILPMSEKERLKLAALIINDISNKPETNGDNNQVGSLREMFGSVSLGHPTGANNEKIDEDLAREYASNHEDE